MVHQERIITAINCLMLVYFLLPYFFLVISIFVHLSSYDGWEKFGTGKKSRNRYRVWIVVVGF